MAAWQKIPKEHHPLFLYALADDERAQTVRMFGGIAAMVNGHMAAGLWADTVVLRLDEAGQAAVLAMDGGREFDPMGKGKPMKDMVLLPPRMLGRRAELRRWIERAIVHCATLRPKVKKKAPARSRAAKPRSRG